MLAWIFWTFAAKADLSRFYSLAILDLRIDNTRSHHKKLGKAIQHNTMMHKTYPRDYIPLKSLD